MRRLLPLLVGAIAALALPGAASGRHTCADYPNQAAAQKAADTIDADHDGIYCESLPCPCLKPGGTGSGGGGGSTSGGLGASIPLHPVTKHTGCRVRGPLPDAGCTPGTRYRRVDKARVCTPGYAGQVRNVPQSRKDAIYRAYGMTKHFNGRNGEVDHLVSL
jgi:hypothetical protein